MTAKDTPQSDAVELRQQAEKQFAEKANLRQLKHKPLTPEESQVALHELGVHQIELEMQNDELRRTQLELDAVRERYFDLYNLAPVGYCTISKDGFVVESNLTAASLLGISKNELVKSPLLRFICKEDQDTYYLHQKQLFSGGGDQDFDLRILKTDATTLWVHLTTAAALAADGSPISRVALSDVNERKLAETSLKQTRANYETFFNTIDEFLFVLDEGGNIIHTNSTVFDRLGYTEEELTGQSVLMVHPPERRDEAGRIVAEMLNGTAEYCPVPIITKSGIQVPVETRVSHGTWNGKPAIFGVSKDISQIKSSEEKFSKVFYLNPSACGLSDLATGKYVEVNEAFQTLLGFGNDEVTGKTPVEVGILTTEQLKDMSSKISPGGKVYNLEAELKAKNGDIKYVLLSAENITVQDKQYRYTVVHDITQRKKAEDQLRTSEERFREVLENSQDAAYKRDLARNSYEYLSPVFGKITGYTQEEMNNLPIETALELMHPDDMVHVKGTILRAVAGTHGATHTTEYRFKHKDGQYCWLKDSFSVMLDASEKPEALIGSVSDITERKQAEATLLEEHQRMGNIIESTNVGTWEWNVKTGETAFNERWAQIIGYSLEELAPVNIKTWETLTHPEDLLKSNELLKKHFAGELPYYECECRMKHKDGHWVWIHDRGSIITRTADGKPLMMFGTHTDISTRKKTDEIILDSEVKYHTLFNNAQVGMARTQLADSKILDINDKAAEIFGCTREEAMGSASIRFWFDPEERAKAAAILKEQGFIKDFENRVIAKNGNLKTCLTSWKLYPETQILEGSIVDITERKLAEAKIEASLEEKTVLLKEIEHRVKNSMQVMSSLLQLQSTYVADPRDAALFKDSMERIKSMALVYERLYQSADMAHISLEKYITKLVSELVHSYNVGSTPPGILVEVADMQIGIETAIPCGLIINEVVSNSLKYAFPNGRQGNISVNIKASGGNLEMSLADDGVGIPESINPRKTASLGIKLIYILVEHQMGGKVEIETTGGTKYKITIPVKP